MLLFNSSHRLFSVSETDFIICRRSNDPKRVLAAQEKRWRPGNPTHPLADGGAPAHDAALQPGVRPNPRPLQDRAALYPHAVLHNDARADGHVRPDGAVLADLRRRVLRRETTIEEEDYWL